MPLIPVKESVYTDYIKHEVQRPYGTFYFFESYLISEIDEGIVFSGKEAIDIFNIALEFYDGNKRPEQFVYLSNRINNYSVKPVDWLDFDYMGSLMVGYGIVDDRKRAKLNAQIEEQFVPCEFGVFDDLTPAIIWAIDVHGRKSII
jgi:hypothetical protein